MGAARTDGSPRRVVNKWLDHEVGHDPRANLHGHKIEMIIGRRLEGINHLPEPIWIHEGTPEIFPHLLSGNIGIDHGPEGTPLMVVKSVFKVRWNSQATSDYVLDIAHADWPARSQADQVAANS